MAVITCGNGYIGQAIAHTFRKAGAKVILWDAPTNRAETAEECSMVVDVAQEQSVARAVADALARFGHIDLLVNGAGLIGKQMLKEH